MQNQSQTHARTNLSTRLESNDVRFRNKRPNNRSEKKPPNLFRKRRFIGATQKQERACGGTSGCHPGPSWRHPSVRFMFLSTFCTCWFAVFGARFRGLGSPGTASCVKWIEFSCSATIAIAPTIVALAVTTMNRTWGRGKPPPPLAASLISSHVFPITTLSGGELRLLLLLPVVEIEPVAAVCRRCCCCCCCCSIRCRPSVAVAVVADHEADELLQLRAAAGWLLLLLLLLCSPPFCKALGSWGRCAR